MKKVLLAASIVFFLSVLNYAGPNKVYEYDKEVTISTGPGTRIQGWLPNRKYTLIVNIHPSYDILVSTFQQKTGDTIGKYIYNSGGFWEEEYAVYQSSRWAMALSTGTAAPVKIKVSEKE